MESQFKYWEKVEPAGEVYSPRTGHAVTSDNQFIYLFGGTDGLSRKNDLFKFDPQNHVWHSIQANGNPPIARSGTQAVMYNGCVYIFGGYTKKDGDYFNDVYRFNTIDDSWQEVLPTSVQDLPEPRTDHSLVTHQNQLVVFGGYDGQRRYNDLCFFNIETRVWRRIETDPKPQSRFGHTAVIYKDMMLIFGGWNGHDTLNEVWAFHFVANRWNQVITTGFIAPRYRHMAVTVGNSMYVFGGVNKEQQRFQDLYELNILEKHWQRVESQGDVPTSRTFHRGVINEGFLYVIGGYDGNRKNDMFRIFMQSESPEEFLENDPLIETIEQLETEPLVWRKITYQGTPFTPRTGHSVIGVGPKFYVFGGTDESNRRNDMHCFNCENKTWTMHQQIGQVPNPRSGSKGVAYKNALFLFGGYTKKDGIYFNDLHRFDLPTLNWTRVFYYGEPPTPRTDHTAVLYENQMYIFGGYDGRNRYNDLRSCHLDSFEWSLLEANGSIPLTRFGHTATVCSHNMYIFGGWDGHDTLDDLYQYSFASNIWYELKRLIGVRPNPRYRHSCVSLNGNLFIFGGVDKHQTRYNDLHQYDIHNREWSLKRVFGQIPSARTFHRAVMFNDEMYILGGFDGKRQNDLYAIRIDTEDCSADRPSSRLSRFEYDDSDMDLDINELLKQNYLLKQQIKDLSDRLQKEEERDVCRICFEREIDSVLLECAHRVMCTRCAQSFSDCPMCRQPITRFVTTFSPY